MGTLSPRRRNAPATAPAGDSLAGIPAELSGAWLASVVTASQDAIMSTSPDGVFLSWNPGAERLYGYRANEIIGRHVSLLVPEDRAADIDRIREVVGKGDRLPPFETVRIRKDGSQVDVELSLSPVVEGSRVVAVMALGRDITERKALQAAQQDQAEARMKLLEACVARLNDIVIITEAEPIDEPGPRIVFVNDAFIRHTGYTREEAIGRSPRFLQGVKTSRMELDRIRASLKQRKPVRSELINYTKTGEEFWVEMEIVPVADATGWFTNWIAVQRDITGRKQAEQALDESRQRLKGIIESAMDAIISVNAEQQIVLFNAAAERMFRCISDDAIGRPLNRFIPSRFRAAHTKHHRRFVSTHATRRTMGRLGTVVGLRSDGEEFPVEAAISHIEVGGENISTVILRDISERRRLEQEVVEISEMERHRIGQDLHDDLGQQLAGLWFLSSTLEKTLRTESPAQAESAATIAAQLDKALALTRSLSRGLQPVAPEPGGLMVALQELAGRTSELFKIPCSLHLRSRVEVRDPATATHLYRIAQEAVTNAARHGQAKHITITLSKRRKDWQLTVEDDGTGIPENAGPHNGLGIRTMQYRAEALGGSVIFQDRTGGGTTVICTIPKPSESPPATY